MKSPDRKRPWLRRIFSVLRWGLFIAFAVAIWPTALGGATSYVIVTGQSMEPTLYAGDFVVLRTGDYEVGDVVSYMPFDDVPAQVIHRILEFKDDGTMTLKGDNNNFIDPFAPTLDDITGKLVFSIPKVGSVGWFLGQPLVWGSLLLIAVALLIYKRPEANSVAPDAAIESAAEGERIGRGEEHEGHRDSETGEE